MIHYIFVLTPFGLLRLMAPIRLVVIRDGHGFFRKGQVLHATRVSYDPVFRIMFEIDGLWHLYQFFGILL